MPEHIVIGDVAPRIQYVASGTQTAFTFPFPIFKPTDLQVFVNGRRLAEGYSVVGAGRSSGGTVTFLDPPDAGAVVTLRRVLRLERLSDFQESGELRARVLNDELDYQTAALQQLADDLTRTVQTEPTDIGGPLVLPPRSARASRLLGFDAGGSIQLFPAEVGGGQILFRQDGEGAVLRTAQDKLAEALSAADFGTVGDGVADDTGALARAFAAAGAQQRTLLIPDGTFRITRGLVFPGTAAGLIMQGRILADLSRPEPALTLGDGGTARNGEKIYWNIRLVRSVLSSWLDEREIGVLVRNIDASLVYIAESARFTIGVQTLGDRRGVEDSIFLLGRIVDNRIGLDVRCATAEGWNASVRYYGGRFAVSSSSWPALDRFGVRFSAAAGAYRLHNRHVFDAPSFELRQQGSNRAIPFLVEVDARSIIARDLRMEGCSPIVARHDGNAIDCRYDVAWASQAYRLDVEYGEATTRAGAILRTQHQASAHVAATRLIANLPNLRAAAFRWQPDALGFDQLACMSSSVAGSPSMLADFLFPGLTGYALTDRGVILGPSRGLGFVVDVRGCKDFALAVDADQPRLFVQCFDASGQLLTDAAGRMARASNQTLVWNGAARWWQSAADLADATLTRLQALRLAPEVATAVVGVVRVDRDYEVRALRLYCEPRHAPQILYGLPNMPHGSREIVVETAWDPPSLAPGATAQLNIPVPAASPGDFVQASFSVATTGVVFLATVGAGGVATVIAWNRSAVAIDLGGGTLRVRVVRVRTHKVL